MKLVDVYAAMLPTHAFMPAVHVSYGEEGAEHKGGVAEDERYRPASTQSSWPERPLQCRKTLKRDTN